MAKFIMIVFLFGPGKWDIEFYRTTYQFDDQMQCFDAGVRLDREQHELGKDLWFQCIPDRQRQTESKTSQMSDGRQ